MIREDVSKEAGPSTPVEILGLNSVPNAGEVFVACDSDKDARSFADTFVSQNREKMLEETDPECLWMICSHRFRLAT